MFSFLRSGSLVRLVCGVNSGHSDSVSESAVSIDSGNRTITSASASSTSVLEVIKKGVPSLCDESSGFKPPLAIIQGDVQTILSCFAQMDGPLCYDRYFVPADNGGTLAVDFASAPWLAGDAPIVIILPGLAGSSQDMYVNSTARDLFKLRNGDVKGYRVAVMNSRGSLGNPLTSAHLTHAGSTEDLRTIVSYVRKSYPEAKALFALGFSMGGALLSNYLAEEGATCLIDAGFCISTVWDLEACSARIEDGRFLRRLMYSYTCGSRLATIVREHANLFRDAGSVGLEGLLSRRATRMRTFNDTFMSRLAGHSDTAAFAAATSPVLRVNKVRRPCVLLNARDDPLYGGECLATVEQVVRESGQEGLVLAITERGGHVGWLQKNKEGNLEQWFIHPVREFFDAMLLQITTP